METPALKKDFKQYIFYLENTLLLHPRKSGELAVKLNNKQNGSKIKITKTW